MLKNIYTNYMNRLNLAQKGGGILFCGAGFSADCLNFNPDQVLGTGAQLLKLFNKKLGKNPPYNDLRNAAEELEQQIGEHGLMNLLTDQFQVSNVTHDMVDILKFPWDAVYTTNYGNAIEVAAQNANQKHTSFNNTDNPTEIKPAMPIIHLHGSIGKWDIHNFHDSCILTGDSYMRLNSLKAWLNQFQIDVEKASFVAFIGFRAEDFHINDVIFNLSGLKEKAMFINRPRAIDDPDLDANQRRLGSPFYFGRDGFSGDISTVLSTDAPTEPRLSSFHRFNVPTPTPVVPEADALEELFIFGKTVPEQLSRDSNQGSSDYHIKRNIVEQILSQIEDGTRIVLLTGVTCDGKTLILNDLLLKLSTTRASYQLVQHYESLLNEVADILKFSPNAVLAIENCFDLSEERLASVAAQFDGKDRVLILTSRSISTLASSAGLKALEKFDSFRHIPLQNLTVNEVDSLIELGSVPIKFFTRSVCCDSLC